MPICSRYLTLLFLLLDLQRNNKIFYKIQIQTIENKITPN